MTADELIKEFRNRFRREPEGVFFCPGRVNLIGEHIDYNGGSVMPCTISRGTYLAAGRNIDKTFRFQSMGFPATASLHVQSSYTKAGKDWFNYPLGVFHELLQEGHELPGMDLLFDGDLPIGAGLSSSASIEVLTAFAASELMGLNISRKDIALLAKKVENEFIGVSCGIMDQFTVALGQKNKALLLNCDTFVYEYLPFDTGEYQLVIINTNRKRALEESKYNERFAECGLALGALKKELSIKELCDLDIASFELNQELIHDPVLRRRALHVVTENARVGDATVALQTSDWLTFGKLLFASHQSLKELYEVTGKELDTIIDFCKEYKDCCGARMTGAGFGGCAIALVQKISFDDFASKLKLFYKKRTGYDADVFAAASGGAVTRI
ncbi:MAG: galactokinase [Chitinophagaceae bacterium]